jgi:FlaA1/EpsC-like NDP-sugar epimerase
MTWTWVCPVVERFGGSADALRRHRKLVSLSAYGFVTAVAYGLAYLLRFEFEWPASQTAAFWLTLPLLLAIRLILARVMKLSAGRWRFVSTLDMVRLMVATSLGSILFYLLTWVLHFPASVPRSVIVLEWLLTGHGTAALWMTYRLLFQRYRRVGAEDGSADRRVLLAGAGEAAAMLVREMVRLPTGYKPVGMVDDDPMKWGTTIDGVEVIGSIHDLKPIAEVEKPDELILAIPTATPTQLNRMVGLCERTDLPFRILPGIAEVLAGEGLLQQLRPVKVEDLLGREPVKLELPELAREVRGRCILVTGAAGSIGSELSRQIALHGPGKLLLLDQAETPLVDLDLELREEFPDLDLLPVVGDVTDRRRVERLFRGHHPSQVFHAAAYKHVPMMEGNAAEAVRNNVVGTWTVARAAGESGTAKFVLVSTDKAVRPVNVMGATKRLAELVALEAQDWFPATGFSAVRFGNVLASAGSVIPLFRKQMERGRPLTVTHPEITRYFMTIPEAVQLILQASLLPNIGGHIAMLDMGEPVRILDLARMILRLSGSPGVIGRDIVFTGLRPGEKLHEELVAPDEETVETPIPKVRLILQGAPEVEEATYYAEVWGALLKDGYEEEVLGDVGAAFGGVGVGAPEVGSRSGSTD